MLSHVALYCRMAMNDEIISMRCRVRNAMLQFSWVAFWGCFSNVFLFVFAIVFLLVRPCLLNTLIKCLKGHKSKKEIVQKFVTKERFTFVQNVQDGSYFGEERQRRGGMGGSSLDARLEVGDFWPTRPRSWGFDTDADQTQLNPISPVNCTFDALPFFLGPEAK